MTDAKVSKPRVSVLMPSYNHGPFVEQALASVFAQTHRDYEIVIVDDGSTDATPERLKKYKGRIRLFLRPHLGISATYKYAVDRARGEWVAFLETDDMWEASYLERVFRFLQEHPNVAWVSTARRLIDERGYSLNKSQRRSPPHPFYSLKDMLAYRETASVYCPTPVVKRDALLKMGIVSSQTLSWDVEMGLRFALSFPMAYVDEPLYLYRIHGKNLSRTEEFKSGEEHLRIFRRFAESYSRRLDTREKKMVQETLARLWSCVVWNRIWNRGEGLSWPRRRDVVNSFLGVLPCEPFRLQHYRRLLLFSICGVRGSFYLRKWERKTRAVRKELLSSAIRGLQRQGAAGR